MYSLPMSPAAAKAISEMPSEDLIAFLKDNGWREAGPFGAYAVRFLSPEPETEKAVIVPISREIADYEWLMINALLEIAKYSKRDTESVLCDIKFYKFSKDLPGSKDEKTTKDIARDAYKKDLEKNIAEFYRRMSERAFLPKFTFPDYTLTQIPSAGVPIPPRTPNIKTAK